MAKKHFVRVVYNNGRTETSEFSNELAAKSYASTMRSLVEGQGKGRVYLYSEGQMPEDCAQAFIERYAQKQNGGVI